MHTCPNCHEQIPPNVLKENGLGKTKSKERHNTGGTILRITITLTVILTLCIPIYNLYTGLIYLGNAFEDLKLHVSTPAASSTPEITLVDNNTQTTN